MRQALLVIVLAGAAFGGGAMAGGPGFRWAQEHLLDYMGLKDGDEIDTLELTPAAAEPLAGRQVAAANSTPAPTATATAAPPPAPTPQATEPYATTRTVATPPAADAKPAAPQGPALLGALGAMLSPPKADAPKPPADPKAPPADPSVALSSLPALEAAPAGETTPASEATEGDWTAIRRKLDSAGVSHYTIDGEPGGRVVFACLIPLAGKQAVSQRFEAEGEDEIQAARTVLKRINLWRVSHSEPAEPRP